LFVLIRIIIMPKKNILFTMTCFLSREDKLIQTLKALRSIHKHEPNLRKHAEIVVINECGHVKGQFLKKEFPWITKIVDKKKKTRNSKKFRDSVMWPIRFVKYCDRYVKKESEKIRILVTLGRELDLYKTVLTNL
jgi:hypothetical protein